MHWWWRWGGASVFSSSVASGGRCCRRPREPLERHNPRAPQAPFSPKSNYSNSKLQLSVACISPQNAYASGERSWLSPSKDTSSLRWQSPTKRCIPKREFFFIIPDRYRGSGLNREGGQNIWSLLDWGGGKRAQNYVSCQLGRTYKD